MSAYVDKNQGFTFVYSNIYDLYQKAKNAKIDGPFVAERPRVLKNQKFEAFQAQELNPQGHERTFPVPMGVKEAEEKAKRFRSVNILQKNMEDLSEAHSRLRFLLKELEQSTRKKS
jgi:hypothetical protein